MRWGRVLLSIKLKKKSFKMLMNSKNYAKPINNKKGKI